MEFTNGMRIRKELTVIGEISYGTEPRYYYDDGLRWIHKFIDSEGNIYVWKTSKPLGCDFFDEKGHEGWEIIEEGDKIFLGGLVKECSNYKGEDQIVITRCKVYNVVEHQSMSHDELVSLKREQQLSKISGDYEIKTVPYREYKNEYQKYETLIDSFVRDDNGCFIDVIIPKPSCGMYYFSE